MNETEIIQIKNGEHRSATHLSNEHSGEKNIFVSKTTYF